MTDSTRTSHGAPPGDSPAESERIVKSEEEWRSVLTREQYRILREKGTERAFTGKYWNHHEEGVYTCAACANPLFHSNAKFESGTGWPSFNLPLSPGSVRTREDRSLFLSRAEVICRRCDSHLGHVFDDGPAPEGLRYCMNSIALDFKRR